jgi:hypothetical protein
MSCIFYYLYTWQPSTCVDLGLLGPHIYILWPYHGSCAKKLWLGMFGVFLGFKWHVFLVIGSNLSIGNFTNDKEQWKVFYYQLH